MNIEDKLTNPHALQLADDMPEVFASFQDIWNNTDPKQRGATFENAWYWFSVGWLQPAPGDFPRLYSTN